MDRLRFFRGGIIRFSPCRAALSATPEMLLALLATLPYLSCLVAGSDEATSGRLLHAVLRLDQKLCCCLTLKELVGTSKNISNDIYWLFQDCDGFRHKNGGGPAFRYPPLTDNVC
jgi:hypothetical protein